MVIEEFYGEVAQLESEPEIVQFGRTPEDVPFPIPSKWKWMSLVEILLEISDGSHNPPPNSGQGIPVLSAKNVNNGVIDAQGVTRWVTEEQWLIEDKKIHIEPGDVLLTIVGSIGRTAVVPDGAAKFMLQRSVCIMKPKTFLDSEFLALMLTSSALFEWMMDRASGTAQKGIYLKTVKAMPFPVPPFSEQQRIVAKTKKIFEQINRAESAYDELSGPLANRFRQLCLEKAIQGRLVPQLESEPDVEQLGESPENVPFLIPKKWKWVRLRDIASSNVGLTYKPQDISTEGTPILRSCNIENGEVVFTDLKRVSKSDVPTKCLIQEGDILMCSRNGSKSLVGKCALMPVTEEVFGFGAFMTVIRSPYNRYLKFYFESDYFRKTMLEANNSTSINQITQKKLLDVYIPLPPIEEQLRIVTRVNEIISEIERLRD